MSYDVLRRNDGGGLLVAPAGAPFERLLVWEGLIPVPLPEHRSVATVVFAADLDGRRVYAERVPRGVRLDEVDLPPGVQELVVVGILEGVAHLHRQRLLHGNVTKAHVHLGVRGEVVLAGRGRKGGIPALDLVAAVGMLPGPGEETLPGESAELAAAELSRRVPPDAVGRLAALVEGHLATHVPLARIQLGTSVAEGTDEVVPDLGPDHSDHGILDRWGTTTATGSTGETTPAARTDAGASPAIDLSEELWSLVARVVATPMDAGPDVAWGVREMLASEATVVLGMPTVVDDAPSQDRSEEFGDEPPTAVRRGQGHLPSELTAQTSSPYVPSVAPSRIGRWAELFAALVVGFVVAAVLAWLW